MEVIVVDNGSADSTLEDIRIWMEENGLDSGRIRIIEMGRNAGVAAGRNAGLKEACGDYLLLLDNDTIANPEAIEGCIYHLEETQGCGICAPALYSPQGELQASAKPFPGLGIKLSHVAGHLLGFGKELKRARGELAKKHPFYLIGAFQMFRREVYAAAGPLDEKIFYGPEDADFCMRVRAKGWSIDYLPQYRLIHDWRRATRRSPLSRLGRLHAAALLHFYIKHRRFR